MGELKGIDAGLAYSKHISSQYTTYVALVFLFGLIGAVGLILRIQILSWGGSIGLGMFLPSILLLGMIVFLAFRAGQYKRELIQAIKERNDIHIGLAYYRHILMARKVCFILMSLSLVYVTLAVVHGIFNRQYSVFEAFGIFFSGGSYQEWVRASSMAIVLPIFLSLFVLIFSIIKAKQYRKEKEAMAEYAPLLEAQDLPMPTDKTSYFDGRLIQFVGWGLLGIIVIPFSLGFAFPWWLCKIYGWKVRHTIVEGNRLKFHGTGMSLFGHWILWSFLTIITLGIFGWWLIVSVNKWLVKNTAFAETESQATPTGESTAVENPSHFDGKLIQLIGWGLLGILIIPLSLGLALPYWLCKIYGWKVNHTAIEGKRLKFNGTGISLFGHYLLWSFLTIITLGIYGWWLIISVNKWLAKNTSFADTQTA